MINYNSFFKIVNEEQVYQFKFSYRKIYETGLSRFRFYDYELYIDPDIEFPIELQDIISGKDFSKIIKTCNEFINYQKPHTVLLLGIYLTIFFNLVPSIISINTINSSIIGVYFLILFIITTLILISNSIYRRNYFHYKSYHELNERYLFKNIRFIFKNQFRSFVILYITFILFLLFITLVFFFIRVDDTKHLKNHSVFLLMNYSIIVYSLISTFIFIRQTLLYSKYKKYISSTSNEFDHLNQLNNNLDSFFKYDPLCIYFIPKSILDHNSKNSNSNNNSNNKYNLNCNNSSNNNCNSNNNSSGDSNNNISNKTNTSSINNILIKEEEEGEEDQLIF